MQISSCVNHPVYPMMGEMRLMTDVFVTSWPVGGSATTVTGSKI